MTSAAPARTDRAGRREAQGREVDEDFTHKPGHEGQGQGLGAATAEGVGGQKGGESQEDREERAPGHRSVYFRMALTESDSIEGPPTK